MLIVQGKWIEPLADWRLWTPPAVMAFFLVIIAQYSFLTFHTLAEFLAIVISLIMFAFAWSTHSFSKNYFVLFLACGYFWIGSLDLMHTFVYKGMDLFVEGNGNLSVQFWIATRFFEAILLFVAPFVIARTVKGYVVFTIFGVAAVGVSVLILTGNFPLGFVEGMGLTPFKIYSEYFIDFILAGALYTLFRYGRDISQNERVLIAASIIFTMAAELAFTFYVSVFGISNLVGHIFKLFSFWFLLQAIVVSNLREPFQELSRLKDYNRRLFDVSPIGLALCRMDGSLVDVNFKFADIIGHNVQDTLNLDYWQITPKAYLDQEQEQLALLDSTGEYGPYIKEYIHKDGRLIPVKLTGKIIIQDGERFIWSSVEDITEHKQLEAQVRRSQKMDAIGQLTGGIAHDFNNILGIALGNLELLQDRVTTDERAAEFCRQAMMAVNRGAEITKKLLRFSSKDSGGSGLISVNDCIRNLESLIARSLTAYVRVETNLADNIWAVEADTGDFEDAILNLSLNARDAMPDGGVLDIETTNKVLDEDYVKYSPHGRTGEFVKISVGDSGTGLSDEVREKMFEPFYSTKDTGRGTGLGLSMVYGFVQRSDGHLDVYSEMGKGTTISIYLPRARENMVPGETRSEEIIDLPKGDEKILIVDDEEALRNVAVSILADLGYSVRMAESSDQAFQILKEDPAINLLFTDIIMPGSLDGYQLAAAVHDEHASVKILLASGFTNMHGKGPTDETPYLARLRTGMLRKPYNKFELATAVRRALDAED